MYLNYNDEIEYYILQNIEPETEILQKLDRETNIKILNPRMLSGHIQGRILSMISKLMMPNRILELGTYTGYSALCLAEGLQEKGKLHTIDINEELEDFANSFFVEAGYSDKIIQHIGNAIDIIPKLDEEFDLVFIDADKENYCKYFNLILPKLRKGGIILADNVLWNGKVVETINARDLETKGIIEYNKLVKESETVETVILPIRDGINLTRKK